MHYLIIPQVKPQDAGEIVCVAKNSEGESQAATTLDVFMAQDFRMHKLRNVYNIGEEDIVMREERWRSEMMGTLGEAFERAPKPDFTKLMRMETEREPIAPMESEELVSKFQRKREEEFYEKILAVDHPKEPPPPLPMETVQLKPSRVVRRELPKEELEKVGLKVAPR